jgi:hypothetical protein
MLGEPSAQATSPGPLQMGQKQRRRSGIKLWEKAMEKETGTLAKTHIIHGNFLRCLSEPTKDLKCQNYQPAFLLRSRKRSSA